MHDLFVFLLGGAAYMLLMALFPIREKSASRKPPPPPRRLPPCYLWETIGEHQFIVLYDQASPDEICGAMHRMACKVLDEKCEGK